jgi:hypothetical protein
MILDVLLIWFVWNVLAPLAFILGFALFLMLCFWLIDKIL